MYSKYFLAFVYNSLVTFFCLKYLFNSALLVRYSSFFLFISNKIKPILFIMYPNMPEDSIAIIKTNIFSILVCGEISPYPTVVAVITMK